MDSQKISPSKKARYSTAGKSAKATLRTKIFLITTLIILLIQGLNSMLEIGFLMKNLEKNYLGKYLLIGTELKRKLEKSMLFGKALEQLNFDRLLEGILPKDIDNLFIVNTAGDTLYAVRRAPLPPYTFQEQVRTVTMDNFYQVSIPLVKDDQTVGNMLTRVSVSHVRGELAMMIRESVKNSLMIIVIVLPFLYLVLSLWINRPYMRSVKRLTRSLINRDRTDLLSNGINPDGLIQAEKQLDNIASGKWLAVESREMLEKLNLFSSVINAMEKADETGQDMNVALKNLLPRESFARHIEDIGYLVSRQEVYNQMVREWKTIQNKPYETC